MFIIKWTNKFSGETGYVESISSKEKHFNNTFDAAFAKKYKTASVAQRMILTLAKYGEADNNDFAVESYAD
ncbi:hypothetical protein J6A31_04750 [bacterium]|nr:hypothetical protein [bacterium]